MTPITGQSVLYLLTPADVADLAPYNGDFDAFSSAPAIVTKVHDGETVDLRVFVNGDVPALWRPRVPAMHWREDPSDPEAGDWVGWMDGAGAEPPPPAAPPVDPNPLPRPGVETAGPAPAAQLEPTIRSGIAQPGVETEGPDIGADPGV